MARAAASLMCAGVSKAGSPGAKSTTSCPSWRRAMAACIAARVEEGCIRATFGETGKGILTAVSVILVPAYQNYAERRCDGSRIHARAQQYKTFNHRDTEAQLVELLASSCASVSLWLNQSQ